MNDVSNKGASTKRGEYRSGPATIVRGKDLRSGREWIIRQGGAEHRVRTSPKSAKKIDEISVRRRKLLERLADK